MARKVVIIICLEPSCLKRGLLGTAIVERRRVDVIVPKIHDSAEHNYQ